MADLNTKMFSILQDKKIAERMKINTITLNSSYLAAGYNNKVTLYNCHSGQKLFCYDHSDVVYDLLFFGNTVVSASKDRSIVIYNLNEPSLNEKLIGHEKEVFVLEQKETEVLSGGFDGQVKLWDFNRAVCLNTFKSTEKQSHCEITTLKALNENMFFSGGHSRVLLYDKRTGEAPIAQFNDLAPKNSQDTRGASFVVTLALCKWRLYAASRNQSNLIDLRTQQTFLSKTDAITSAVVDGITGDVFEAIDGKIFKVT